MNLTSIKQAVCKFLFLIETAVLFFLLSAALQGTLSLLVAIGYAALSFVGVNLVSCLILPTEEVTPAPRQSRSPASSRSAVPLRVVPGGRHAA